MSRKEELKKAEIMDTAANCFMLRGFDATSIDQIADAHGSTKGLIYYHFRSKANLFFQVYRRAIQRTIDRATPVAEQEGPAAERLHTICKGHILGIMRYLPYHHVSKQGVELQMANALTPEQSAELRDLIKLRDAYQALYRKVIEDGLEDGTLQCRNASLAARMILGALNGFSVWYRPRPEQTEADMDALAEEVVEVVIGGVLPHSSISGNRRAD